jgi:hypothetical protein
MKRLIAVAAAAVVAAPLFGAAQLTFPIKGVSTPIAWEQSAFPVEYRIDTRAAAGLPGGAASVDAAFRSWSGSEQSAVAFRQEGSGTYSAGKDGVNSVSIQDELFAGSGFLAFTTTWFDDSGRIVEADIQLDLAALADQARAEALIEHEVGHLLGLDHSAVVSATMYPFVGATGISGLDSDDRLAIAAIYPAAPRPAPGLLRGRVDGAAGPLFGGQVVAIDADGAPVASGLTLQDGTFELEVPPGAYKVYVEPLDGPVGPRNLSGVWRNANGSVFRTEFLARNQFLQVAPGQVHEGLILNAGVPASLNPKWIGAFPAGTSDVKLSSTAVSVRGGDTISIAIGGDGMVGGMTRFEVLSPGFARTSEFSYGPNYVWATFRVAPETAPGPVVILAESGNETAMLTGALRVTAANPAQVPPSRRRPAGR